MPEYNFTLKSDPRGVMIQCSGKSGATVDSVKECQLLDVEDFEPELAILENGTNDLPLPAYDPEKLASATEKLADSLIKDYNVQHVVVQILHRFRSLGPIQRRINIEQFNRNVDTCNQ